MFGINRVESLLQYAATIASSIIILWLLFVFIPTLYLLIVERILIKMGLLKKRLQPYLLIRIFNRASVIYILFACITAFVFYRFRTIYVVINILAFMFFFSYSLGKYTDHENECYLGFKTGFLIVSPPVMVLCFLSCLN